MRLVFFGTPADAVPALDALVRAGHDVALVVTQPDRRRGRGGATAPSPVRAAADTHGLPVRTPQRAGELVDELAASGAEVGVVVAFGQLLPQSVIDALPRGLVNIHFSLLPRWRGAAPVERAMLAGDRETGVCIMQIDAGLDTGPVLACDTVPIADDETAGELRTRLVDAGVTLLVSSLARLDELTPRDQHGDATIAAKLTVDEFALDWSRSALELDRLVRAGNPRPGAWTHDDDHRLKVWRTRVHPDPPDGAAQPSPSPSPSPGLVPGTVQRDARVVTGAGVLELVEVQPEGRARMAGTAWLAGRRSDSPLGER